MAGTEPLAAFMNTPLVQWVQLVMGRESLEVEDLIDGIALNDIMLQIDPRPSNAKADKKARGNINLMIQNLTILLKHIKAYYEDIQQQVIVMSPPNILILVREPGSEEGIIEMQKLLLLLLGCAVQCDDREWYIEKMKQLTYTGMEIMMNHIKDVTENTDNVLNLQWIEQEEQLPPAEMDELSRNMTFHVRKLAAQRDEFSMMITGLTQERDYLQSQQGSPNASLSRKDSFASPATKQHLLVELADIKSKLRKTKQELDEKVEHSNDLKNELDEKEGMLKKLRQEISEMTKDARAARAYRDENDILKEKATKATRLEHEVERLRERLKDVDFYKQRVEELRDDNKVLHETKAMLEDNLEAAQSRLDELVDAEKKIVDLKQQISSLLEDKDKDHQRIQELVEENMNLEMDKKQSMNESGNLAYQLEQAKGSSDGPRMSIQAESEESAQNRILRLEKENRRLQSMINSYKVSMSSSQLTEANLLEMEKENKRLGNKVQQLQELLSKEKHSVLDYEQLSGDMMAEKKKIETMLETVKANSTRQLEELQSENEQLTKTVETLRKRSKINAEGKMKDIEKENKVLSETVKEVTARINQIEFEKKQLLKASEQAKELSEENTKLEKDNLSLQKTVAQLKITCDQVEKLEQMNSDLDIENRQLKKQVDSLRSMTMQLQDIEKDKGVTEQEASKLRRQVESLKKTCEKMSHLEQEKLESEKALKRMRRSMEAMKQSKEQTEKMETLQAELENELERVRSQLDVSQVSKEKEIQELEKENEELQVKLDKLVTSAKKVEHYEREYQKLESDNSELRAAKKKLSKEAQRAKHTLEEKSAKLEETVEELASMNRQNKAMMRQIEKGEDSSNRIKELETEVREMKKHQSVEKKTLTTLREGLVNEKLLVQQKQSELDRLSSELESIGLNKEQLLSANSQSDEKRFKALESRFESTFKKSVEAKEEKIQSLEARLKESASLNNKLREDIKNIKRDYEALAQRHNEEVDFSKSKNRSSRDYSATTELLKIKDHLIEVERKNATLIAENSSIQSMSQDLKEQVTKLRSQNEKLIIQQTKLQDQSSSLQTQCAKLQVENSTLQSQTTSLLSQNASVTNQQGQMESEKQDMARQLDDMKQEKENLEKDHDDLMQLHENQTMEVETLMQDHQKLKSQHKKIRVEYKDLEEKYSSLVRTKEDVEKLRKRLESEVERKHNEGQLVEGNLDVMKEAHEKLNSSYKKLSSDYEELQEKNRNEKSSHNKLKLEYANLEAEMENMKDQYQQLDFTKSKLSNRCDVLMQLKLNLEDENRHLLEQINRLMSQNEELLSQTLESKDQIYSEQKQYTERMQEIRRQKEKLEEKIMDLYRTPGPSPPKRRGFGATLKKTFQNLGKGSENRRRRDGLPPSSTSTSKLVGSSPRSDSTASDQKKEFTTPRASDRDSESVGSNSSESQRKTSAAPSYRRVRKNLKLFNQLRRLYPIQKRGSYTLDPLKDDTKGSKDTKRRSRLGGSMAYSTNALNALSTANGSDTHLDSNRLKDFQSIEDIHGGMLESRISLDQQSVDSYGSEASSQHLRKTVSQLDSASSLSGSIPKGRLSSASSEDQQQTVAKTPTGDKISLQQFLDETKNKNSQSPANHDQTSHRSNVTLRPRTNPQARPTSMIEKPTSSVSPYAHLAPQSASVRAPRNDTGSANSSLNRSGSALERLDSLVSSPRGSSTPVGTPGSRQPNGLSSTPRRSETPTHRATHASYTSMSLPRPSKRPSGHPSAFSPRGGALTSTPASSRQTDIALVNPMKPGTPGTPTRRDVPPDVVPSPIRRDVPPGSDSHRTPGKGSVTSPSLPANPPAGRRPPTPTKPKNEETSQDSDKSTLWFEYGCV